MKSAPETEIETPKHVYKILNALFNLEQTNNKSQFQKIPLRATKHKSHPVILQESRMLKKIKKKPIGKKIIPDNSEIVLANT